MKTMVKPYFITAIGTPLDDDDNLHVAGLEAHLDAQWSSGIDAILIADESLLLHYTFDQADGTIVRDRSGYNHNGTVHGGVDSQVGTIGFQRDESVLLPTEQTLRPAERTATMPGRPIDMKLSPNDRWLVVTTPNDVARIDAAGRIVTEQP
jgi:hypothetical protein